MAWRFDPIKLELVFVVTKGEFIQDGLCDFGGELNSDLELSCGSRENDSSVIDQGLRIIEV
jgi:hypothetical protein